MALVTCPTCNTVNRLPSIPTKRIRCGQCKHEFTPLELATARPEPPPARPVFEDFDDLEGDEDDY